MSRLGVNRVEVSETLRARAVELEACKKALDEWTSNPDGLCELYFRFLDFCMEHDYPSNDYLKRHFNGVMQRHGIFVDDCIDGKGHRQVVCNGTTSGCIRYDGYDVGTLTVRHDSDLRIDVEDFACVVVRVYDRARVRVNNHGQGRVSVLHYGGEVNCSGEVAVPVVGAFTIQKTQ